MEVSVGGGGSGSGGITGYANLAAFPSAVTTGNGALGLALDTNIVYESDGSSWRAIAQPGDALTLGALDAAAATATGANLSSAGVLSMQSADATHPGLVSTGTQTLAGAKTFSSDVNLASGKFLKYNSTTVLYTDANFNAFLAGSGNATLSGSNNLTLGQQAGVALTSGQNNVGVGGFALFSNTIGGQNTAVGSSALVRVVSSGANTAVGANALENITSAENTGVGYYTQNATTSGNHNSSVGTYTLFQQVGGSNNVAFGWGAGYNSGLALTTLNQCTFLGTEANSSTNSISNSTAIGYQAQATTSNQMVFGNSSVTANVFQGDISSATHTLSGLTASQAVFSNGSKQLVSNAITGSGNVVMSTSPTLVTPVLGTPSSGTLTSCTGLPLSTGVTGTLPVANGGTGLTSGTSGGVLAYTASGTLASSGALTASQLVIGGGAGAAPSSLAAGSQYQVLRMGASNPAYGSINLDQSAAVTGVLPIANGGNGSSGTTVAKTSSYTLVAATDSVVTCDCSSADFTITLPTAIGVQGATFTIVRTNSTASKKVTLNTTSSQTIGEFSSGTITLDIQGEGITVVSDNANWQILSYIIPERLYTITASGPTGWSTNRSDATIRKSRDQTWHGIFRIDGSLTSSTGSNVTLTGVVFKSGMYQALYGCDISNGGLTMYYSRANDGASTISWAMSAGTTRVLFQGDIELNAKPTIAM